MTQLVLGLQNNLFLPLAEAIVAGLTAIFKFLKSLAKSFSYAVAMQRQIQANQQVAYYLIKEYPHHTVESLAHELNIQTLKSLQEEFDRD